MTAILLAERPKVRPDLIEFVGHEKSLVEMALNSLQDGPFDQHTLLAAGVPEDVLRRLRNFEDVPLLEAILMMRWHAFTVGVVKGAGDAATSSLDLEIQ